MIYKNERHVNRKLLTTTGKLVKSRQVNERKLVIFLFGGFRILSYGWQKLRKVVQK